MKDLGMLTIREYVHSDVIEEVDKLVTVGNDWSIVE